MNSKQKKNTEVNSSELQFQHIPLSDITPDPNQPRKFYEEQAMLELTESVRESGVLQPILVRKKPKGKGFILVCGERRYRAAVSVQKIHKERNTIPTVIRELTDEDALQLQIVENLQRKDVHPMEEAVAFKSFIDGKNWTFAEIGKRVGKSEYYVRQRMKLNSLITPLQQLFFKYQMDISTALDIARTDSATQELIFEDYSEDALSNPDYQLRINQWQWEKYHANLDTAPFDICDPSLNEAMGPCTQCQFNSSVSKLFPDTQGNTACGNSKCFREKANRSYELHLQLAQDDPAIVLITDEYSVSNETKHLMKSIDGILERNGYDVEEMPEIPVREAYEGNNDTEAEDEAEFQEDVRKFHENEAKWNKKVETGAYVKAFVVSGSNKGKYTFVKLKKVLVGKDKVASTSSSKQHEIAIEEIDAEIQRLKDKEKRAKEIDGNKMWEQIKVQLIPGKYAEEMKNRLSQLEIKAVVQTMHNALGWQAKEEFRKLFMYDSRTPELGEINPETFNRICRYFFLSLLAPSCCTTGITHNPDASLCFAIAETYFPDGVLEIQNEIGLKTDKRVLRCTVRIKELQGKKKEMKRALKSNQ